MYTQYNNVILFSTKQRTLQPLFFISWSKYEYQRNFFLFQILVCLAPCNSKLIKKHPLSQTIGVASENEAIKFMQMQTKTGSLALL